MPTPQGPSINALCGNSFVEVKGKEHLETFKVREGAPATLVCCKECKSCLFVQHKGVEPHVVIVNVEQTNLTTKRSQNSPLSEELATLRTFTCDWDKKYDPNALEIPAFKGKGPTIFRPGPGAMLSEFGGMSSILTAMKTPAPRPAGSITAVDIIKDLPEPTILNLDQMSHTHK